MNIFLLLIDQRATRQENTKTTFSGNKREKLLKKYITYIFLTSYLISKVPNLSHMNGKTHLKMLQTNKE